MPRLDAAVLQRLAQYDTPTVCNVVELWDLRPRSSGYMDARIRACFPEMPPMVGYALTCTFRSAAPPVKGGAYSGLADQLRAFEQMPGPPVMVFQDLDDPPAAATFGEVMCSTYQRFGARGLVTSGAGRDLEQVRALGFPVFTSGALCAHGYCHFLDVNVPVRVGGVTVYPGDLLHGDCNGVTTIPHEIASEVPDACEELIAAERIVLDYLRGEQVTISGYEEARAAHAEAIRRLQRRLTGR
ncbi:MAG: RraA family protein [Planctomycetota bacterium]|nr:MAG: RraA family protein [Planctomycetota bacterium]